MQYERNGVWEMDASSSLEGKRNVALAVKEANPGTELCFTEPGVYFLGNGANQHQGEPVFISKNLTFRNMSGGKVEIYGLPNGAKQMFHIRNSDKGVKFLSNGIEYNAGKLANPKEDGSVNCFLIEAGKPGTKSEVRFFQSQFRKTNGALNMITDIFGSQSDDDLVVEMESCLIEDTWDDRNEDGTKQGDGGDHAGGVYQDGGTFRMQYCYGRRIGWIPGSNIYKKSNKNQFFYGVKGIRTIIRNLVEDSSHGGFAFRAGKTKSAHNIVRRCPIAFQSGHRQTPWLAEVDSSFDCVEDGSHILNANGDPELTCGWNIECPAKLRLSNFSAWNRSGRGDWGGIHVRAVSPVPHWTELPNGLSTIEILEEKLDWGNRNVVVHQSQIGHPGLSAVLERYPLK